MLAQRAIDGQRALVRNVFHHSEGAISRAGQVASAVNALLIFTSFFGLLGVGVFLQAADALIRLRGTSNEEIVLA